MFGLGTAILGILKNKSDPTKTPEEKKISIKKALPTLILTTIAGIWIVANDMPFTDGSIDLALAGLASVGAAEWVNKGLNIVYKKFNQGE